MTERLFNNSENPQRNIDAEFVNFSKEQEKRIRQHILNTGLPTQNVNKVIYKPNQKGEENVLGSFQPYNGTLTLYKSLDNLPAVAQHATVVHELAHSSSPFDSKNAKLYGSEVLQQDASKHVAAVAKQSMITRKYLNGYQAYLHKQLEAGQINPQRFVEETHAIMTELRFNNPKHLKQVETSQIKELNKIKKTSPNVNIKQVNLLTTDIEAKQGKVSGVDRTIVNLIPNLKSKEDIDNHVNNIKNSVTKKGTQLFPNKSFALAA